MRQAWYDSRAHSILYGIGPISYTAWSQKVTWKKIKLCPKCDFSETTVPIWMRLLQCHDVLSLIKFLKSKLNYVPLCMCKNPKWTSLLLNW